MQSWIEKVQSSKWPHMNEDIALRKTLTVRNATEQTLWHMRHRSRLEMGKPVKKSAGMRLYVGSVD